MHDYNIPNNMQKGETLTTSAPQHDQHQLHQHQQQMLIHQQQHYATNFMSPHNPYQNYFAHQTRQNDVYGLNGGQVMDGHILPSSISISTASVATATGLTPMIYPDYILKYEKPEDQTSYANCRTNRTDDNCDSNNNNNNADAHGGVYSTIYNTTENKDKLYMRANSLLDNYGNSVFDSPISLATSTDESNCNAILSTLNPTRDYTTANNRLQSITSNSSSLNGLTKNIVNSDNNINNVSHLIPPRHETGAHTNASNKTEQYEILKTKAVSSSSMSSTDIHGSKSISKSNHNSETVSSNNSSSIKQSKANHASVLNDYELITLPLRELNKRLRYMPKPAAIDLKKRRRTLKNRKYAQNCRSKRLEQKCEIEVQNIRLKAEINRLQKIVDTAHKEKCLYKAYIDQVTKDQSNLDLNQLDTLKNMKTTSVVDPTNLFTEMNNVSPSSSIGASSIESSASSGSSSSSTSTINSSHDMNY